MFFEVFSVFCFSLGRRAKNEPDALSFFGAKEPTFYRLKNFGRLIFYSI